MGRREGGTNPGNPDNNNNSSRPSTGGCGSGIMGGYNDGTLKPGSGATRAHLAALLQRFCVGA